MPAVTPRTVHDRAKQQQEEAAGGGPHLQGRLDVAVAEPAVRVDVLAHAAAEEERLLREHIHHEAQAPHRDLRNRRRERRLSAPLSCVCTGTSCARFTGQARPKSRAVDRTQTHTHTHTHRHTSRTSRPSIRILPPAKQMQHQGGSSLLLGTDHQESVPKAKQSQHASWHAEEGRGGLYEYQREARGAAGPPGGCSSPQLSCRQSRPGDTTRHQAPQQPRQTERTAALQRKGARVRASVLRQAAAASSSGGCPWGHGRTFVPAGIASVRWSSAGVKVFS